MSDQPGTLEQLAILLGRVLARVSARLGDDQLRETLAALGVALPPALLQQPAVVAARDALTSAADQLPAAVEQLVAAAEQGDLGAIVQRGEQVRTNALALVAKLATLPAALDSARAAFPEITDAAIANLIDGFPRKLLDLVTAEVLDEVPAVGAALTMVGLVERRRPFETDPDPELASLEQSIVRYDRITPLLDNPVSYFASLYDWGAPGFDGTKVLPALSELLARLDVPTAYHAATESNPPLLEAYVVDVTPTPKPTGDPATLPGLDFTIVAPFGGSIDETVALPAPGWTARFTASGGFTTSLTASLRPPLAFVMTSPAVTLEGKAEAALTRDTGTPLVILGAAGGSRLEVKTIGLGVTAAFSTAAGAAGSAPALTGSLKGGRVVIDGSQGDGFINILLSGRQIDAAFDVGFAWSVATGLRFDGSTSLTILLPASADFGPFALRGLSLIATLAADGVALEVSAGLAATLGPVTASVSRLGFIFGLTFPSAGGNLGPAELDVRFKPPSGVGVSVDAGPISGGGFLDYDEPSGRYAGALALLVYGVQVKAIGLLDTRLPGGERGYSFLVIVSVEFSPVQLGFGFTLNGVGGLAGINRDLITDALQAALRAHNLDHVLFPPDPIKNAPAIISDLRAIFPPREGRYVFAPMFKLAWGGGLDLVTAELAVLLTLPSPIVIALLGQMKVMLPRPELPIVALCLDVLGLVEPSKKRLSIDATLRDSRIAQYTVNGDMAFRYQWGPNGNLALSIGGLNPHFQPPAGFPTLQRLTIALSSSASFRMTAQCYLAVTSNTFQIGALAELYAASGSFNVYGWFAFDALFVFKPFSFVTEVSGGLALREGTTTLMGISFQATLTGTSPWHAKGEAHISLWFFDVGVSFDHVWGDDAGALEAPPIDAWPQLRDAIGDARNWASALPANVPPAVTFVTPSGDAAAPAHAVLIEPSGVLTMRERLLPLDQTLAKFGEAVPAPQNVFTLDTVALGGRAVPFDVVRDAFAPAQFEDLTDQDKLSRPSFEDRDAGFSVGGDQMASGMPYVTDVVFRDIYVDDRGPRPSGLKYALDRGAQLRWSATGGAARSPLVAAAVGRYVVSGKPPLVSIAPETYVVANVLDLQPRVDVTAPVTKGEAYLALAAHLSRNPGDRDALQVIPVHEAAA